MRSRYSAYCISAFPYILDTYSAEKRSSLSVDALAESAQGTRWLALTIHNDIYHQKDTVEFSAYYLVSKTVCVLHETSRFIIENEQWRYVDGHLHNDCGKLSLGRNDNCICGSEKKFKQCCMKKAL
nr:YchJ family metal-binding protein [Alteromonas pelagimontana]